MWRGTDRQTDTRTAVANIHFASAMPHVISYPTLQCGSRLTYSSQPVWRDNQFALVASNAELPVDVVLTTLNAQHTD